MSRTSAAAWPRASSSTRCRISRRASSAVSPAIRSSLRALLLRQPVGLAFARPERQLPLRRAPPPACRGSAPARSISSSFRSCARARSSARRSSRSHSSRRRCTSRSSSSRSLSVSILPASSGLRLRAASRARAARSPRAQPLRRRARAPRRARRSRARRWLRRVEQDEDQGDGQAGGHPRERAAGGATGDIGGLLPTRRPRACRAWRAGGGGPARRPWR